MAVRIVLALIPAVLGLSACSAGSPGPHAGMLGYGTPSVAAYVPADEGASVRAELQLCDRVPPPGSAGRTQGLPAACDQLRRTLRNQPGNGVRPTAQR